MSDITRAGGPFPIGNTYPQFDDKNVTTVQVGENKLSDVAGRLGVDPKDLQKANPQFSDSTVLKAGQEIKLPQNQGSQGPGEARDRDDGARERTSQPPSSPVGDPLLKGFIQSKLDGAGKTEFSAKDLGQAAGGASAGKFQPEFKKVQLENQAPTQKQGGYYQWIKDKAAGPGASEQVSPDHSKAKVPPQKDGTTGTASGPGQESFDVLKLKPW